MALPQQLERVLMIGDNFKPQSGWQHLWQTLTAPRATDADEARREYMTKVISLIMSLVSGGLIGIFGSGWLCGLLPLDSLFSTVIMTVTFGCGWWLSYRGHWNVAGYFPPAVIFLTAVYGNWIGGAGAPAMLLYALALALTAALHGERAQWLTLLVSVAAYVGIGWAIRAGHLTQLRFPETAFANRVVIFVGTNIALAALLWFLVSQFRLALSQARAYAERLAAANQELAQEIAERKRAEEALTEKHNLLQMLIDSTPDDIYLKDRDHRFLLANQATIRIIGAASFEDLVGKTDADFYPLEKIRQYAAEEQSVLDSGQPLINREDCLLDSSTGTRRWVLTTKVPLRDKQGRITGLVGFNRDITERKQVEEEIRKLNIALEQRVAERTAELQASLENLRRAQKQLVESEKMAALGALVAGIAHEINTPLGVGVTAASYLELQTQQFTAQFAANTLKRSDLEQYVKIAAESAAIILSNLHRAARLITSFKRVAVDQSAEEKRRFHLKDYLEDILFSLRPYLKKTRHTVAVACPEHLELTSYPGAFSQILSNLIMNSLIHGFESQIQGAMTIAIAVDSAALRLTYSDNGKGIAREHLPKIFDPFFTTRRAQNSTGLGLYIVYNLVTQQLKGAITCESGLSKGATFYIDIPAADLEIAGGEMCENNLTISPFPYRK